MSVAACSFLAPGLLGGCLDEATTYTDPERVPPVVITAAVDPPTRETRVVALTETVVSFDVPFRSDDAGEGLFAYFIFDIKERQGPFTNILELPVDVPPSSLPFSEQLDSRSVPFTWTLPEVDRPVGLHTVTMILSHRSNFVPGQLDRVVDRLAAVELTWFIDFDGPGEAQ